jgi:hypothetical protein
MTTPLITGLIPRPYCLSVEYLVVKAYFVEKYIIVGWSKLIPPLVVVQ